MSKIIEEGVVGVNKVVKDQKVRRSFPFIRFLISLELPVVARRTTKKSLGRSWPRKNCTVSSRWKVSGGYCLSPIACHI